ncbi:MAG: 2-oxoacid:acceptor oxidoreductase subunit alpha [Ktedonobacterales bacterium]|nr:2-oxoacid:acceptor oxidoreductase subunit alpha [Ktedonobacterales bacterium]
MSTTSVQRGSLVTDVQESPAGVNNFCLVAATVNGSGSQTANSCLLRAFFKMGIPVSGKNIFPSNIQGLPTWFEIRLSDEGFTARRASTEIMVAMNRATLAEDITRVAPGGMVILPAEWKHPEERGDITYYTIPVQPFAKEATDDVKMRPYVANMVYVGALTELLNIEIEAIEEALLHHFKGKRKPVDLNFGVVKAAIAYTRQNITKRDPFRVQRANKTEGKLLLNGNEAGALGAVFGGFTVAAWYPITPSTSLVDALTEFARELRVDQQAGTRSYAIVQAEDEIAAIGMIVGAGWAGARAMTSTSGPGISLMTEYAGLANFAEIPCVIWDIQRMGPSTGLPTRVSQGDVLKVYYLGHGDTKQIVLLPGSMAECFEFGWRAFDLAERLQTPVFVLSDLDLGMNLWMTEPFDYPNQPMDRGKVLSAEDLERLGGFKRYADVDGDGIPYRTLPGTDHPLAAYFTRGSGHNAEAQYTERTDEWEANLTRLHRKHEHARTLVPPPLVDEVAGAEIGLIAYGSTDPAIVEARAMLAKRGVKTSYLRLRALPTTAEFQAFIAAYPRVFVIENNFEGQMARILMADAPAHASKITSVSHCDGMPLTGLWIAHAILGTAILGTASGA